MFPARDGEPTPNDPKLSHVAPARMRSASGEPRRPRGVGCSAWLGALGSFVGKHLLKIVRIGKLKEVCGKLSQTNVERWSILLEADQRVKGFVVPSSVLVDVVADVKIRVANLLSSLEDLLLICGPSLHWLQRWEKNGVKYVN